MTTVETPSPFASRWSLDPDVVFLNHGSFGACPRRVMAHQQALREQLDRQPRRFMVSELPELLIDARSKLAGFVGAAPENLGFVRNATSGVNAVLRSLEFQPGDQIYRSR